MGGSREEEADMQSPEMNELSSFVQAPLVADSLREPEMQVWVPRSQRVTKVDSLAAPHLKIATSPHGSAVMQGVRHEQKSLRMCGRFAREGRCDSTSCQAAHTPLEQRPPCTTYSACGTCPFGTSCWWPHCPPTPFSGATIALQCAAAQMERVVLRLEHLLGSGVVCGAVRCTTAKSSNVLLFIRPLAGFEDPIATLSVEAPLCEALSRAYALDGSAGYEDLRDAIVAVTKASNRTESAIICVRSCPPELSARVVEELVDSSPDSCDLFSSFAKCTHVLDIVLAYDRFYCSLVAKAQAPQFSATSVARIYGAGGALCRAFFKLQEAFMNFPKICILEAGATALDIGASPGGWTQVLAARVGDGGRVFAVDPGTLELAPVPRCVTHLRAKMPEVLIDLAAALQQEGRQLNAVVCDANVHPEAAGRFISELAPLVANGAFLVLTYKGFCHGVKRYFQDVEKATAQLEKDEVLQKGSSVLTHLLANGPLERTLVARFHSCAIENKERMAVLCQNACGTLGE